jgi:uncharacterized protein (TIGR00369 family)
MSDFDWTAEEIRCFGCGDNPWGLDLDFKKNGEWLEAETSLDRNYQGFRTSAHGGILATLLDEASSWAVMEKTNRLSPSYKLECEFLEPVPLEEKVVARARVLSHRHGIAKSKAEVLDKSGNLLAKARVQSKVLDEVISTDHDELLE